MWVGQVHVYRITFALLQMLNIPIPVCDYFIHEKQGSIKYIVGTLIMNDNNHASLQDLLDHLSSLKVSDQLLIISVFLLPLP